MKRAREIKSKQRPPSGARLQVEGLKRGAEPGQDKAEPDRWSRPKAEGGGVLTLLSSALAAENSQVRCFLLKWTTLKGNTLLEVVSSAARITLETRETETLTGGALACLGAFAALLLSLFIWL